MFPPNNYQLLESFPGLVAVKDMHSTFQYVNQRGCEILGYNSLDELLATGGSYDVIRSNAVNYAETFMKEDRIVMRNTTPLKILGLYSCFGDEWRILIAEKKPLFDEANLVKGIVCYYQDVTESNIVGC